MAHERFFTGVGLLGIYAGGKQIREHTGGFDVAAGEITALIGFLLLALGLWGCIKKNRF